MAQQRAKHRARRLIAKRAYYEANKATISERQRQWRAKNAESIRARGVVWNRANPDRLRVYAQRTRERIRLQVLGRYSDGEICCACCGEHRLVFLALDHVDGAGNAHRRAIGHKAGLAFYRWVITAGFPPMFRVLCHNCNCARGWYGRCPHEDER